MDFTHTVEQRAFADALEGLLSAADPVAAARAWRRGDWSPGLGLWRRLADQGVQALLVPEQHGGMDAGGPELVIAFEALGRHAVPGPYVESAAFLPSLIDDDDLLAELASGQPMTVAAPPQAPCALDAEPSERVFLLEAEGLRRATPAGPVDSIDPTRRLSRVDATGGQIDSHDSDRAFDVATLATSAQLLGCGERLLRDAVDYVKQRRQFGREIGSYQAVKHQLADVRIALDFARPLVFGAALDLESVTRARDVSAAKVTSAEAAYRASRVALQVHGAIGYTEEFDLSLWLMKVRALVGAWGTPSQHRGRVLQALVKGVA